MDRDRAGSRERAETRVVLAGEQVVVASEVDTVAPWTRYKSILLPSYVIYSLYTETQTRLRGWTSPRLLRTIWCPDPRRASPFQGPSCPGRRRESPQRSSRPTGREWAPFERCSLSRRRKYRSGTRGSEGTKGEVSARPSNSLFKYRMPQGHQSEEIYSRPCCPWPW